MWKPIDTVFFAPKLPVVIIALPNSFEVQGLRTFLEMLNCVVLVHFVGTPYDFLQVIGQDENIAPIIIIAGHGSDEGLYFGEFMPSIDVSALEGEYMPASVIKQHCKLSHTTIISSTCNGAEEALIDAFQVGNNITYIGCEVQPQAAATIVFITNLLFNFQYKQRDMRDSWYQAVQATDHPDIYEFTFVHPNTIRERYR
jgi:hypothetical protein